MSPVAAPGDALASLSGQVPDDRLARVRQAVGVALSGAAVETVEPITGGASGAGVYKLAAGGRAYLLRLEAPPDAFRDPVRQYACQRIAAEAGVAPALFHADPRARVSISAFITTAPAEAPRLPRLVAVAEAVRRLHAAPRFPPLMPYIDAMNRLLGDFAASGVVPRPALQPTLDLYARLASIYPRNEADLVASHNDLNPGNVLYDGKRAMVIDWESAFAADRYVDLSAMLNFFAADEAEEALLLETYFGRPPNAAERGRLYLMRQVNRLFYGVMMIGGAAREQPDLRLEAHHLSTPRYAAIRNDMPSLATTEGRLSAGCVFFSEALHGLRDGAFETALALVRSRPGAA